MGLPNVEEQAFLNEPIYDIKSKTGDIDVEAFAEDKDEKKEPTRTPHDYIPSGTAVADLSAETSQMNELLKRDATTGELYVDDFGMAADIYSGITSDIQNLRNKTTGTTQLNENTAKHFDNVNSDNYRFYKDVGATATDLGVKGAEIYGKPFGGGPLGAFASGMVGVALGAGFPLGTAASWVAYGFAQERDQNNFVKLLGNNGMTNLLGSDQTWEYTARPNMNAKQYMNHILYNSSNPGYRLKKYAKYGNTPQDALSNFMNDGIDKGVFTQDSILSMAANRHDAKPGTDSYSAGTAAQQALRRKGWEVTGRVSIDPQGNQYLDGNLWTKSDLSGTIKDYKFYDKPEVTTTKEKEPEVITTKKPEVSTKFVGTSRDEQQKDAQEQREREQRVQREETKYKDTATTGAKAGYTFGLQAGGPIGNPMGQQQEQQPVQDAGNLELVQEQGKDQSGVADDVKRDLDPGDFVINAPAREMAGHSDIERMITKAITELQRKGVKLDFGQKAEDPDSIVQALVSNKELIIPKVIAQQIGYDRLEKINNRGKERVDEIEKEQQQQEKGFVQGQPQAQRIEPQQVVQMGGQITLEENKNQPIAVPKESFATMSSVGKRLLSPLSPEQADKELTELSKPSQSFEGFIKPITMADGGKVYNNPGNIEIETDASGKKLNESYGDGRFAIFNTKEEGLAAIPHTLEKYNTNSVADAINIWKPVSETGNTSEANKNTIDHIIKGLGKDTFDLSNPNDIKVLIEGITRFDSGTDSLKYYDSNSIEKATDMYLGITTPTIIPKPKPQQTGMMAQN